jgi:hypothetical protein
MSNDRTLAFARIAAAASILLSTACASNAQTAPQRSGGGVLDLPEGISRVIAIDAHNILLAETNPEVTNEPRKIVPITVRHVYAGGIARLFGGEVVPTEQFVSPAFNNAGNGNGGNANRGNRGGFNNRSGASPFSVSPTIGNNGFGNRDFGNNGFGNSNTELGNQNFNNFNTDGR